jgi:hypothetical protein
MSKSLINAMNAADKPCAHCGGTRFMSDSQAVFHSVDKTVDSRIDAILSDQKTGPAAYMVICRGCGRVEFFAAIV